MAMERLYCLRDTHSRAITALGFNPTRREIMMGCEDGVIKTWEADTGKHVTTHREHKGWVTDFLYWNDQKVIMSASNDGYIIAWGSGGGYVDKIVIGMPVYCMSINPRRHQLICGMGRGINVYSLDEERESGHLINTQVQYIAREHTDIVRSLVCYESRVYSGGYDQKFIIYDSSYTGDESMEPILINATAHDAGITCLLMVKDNENNTWVVTGSFDKTIRVWSMDGKLVHKLDGFVSTVSGICYLPRNKTIWAAGGSSYAYVYDPKSGENVTEFIGTFQTEDEEKYHLQLIKYFPELNQVVGSTSRRNLMVWKYNPSGCITTLTCNRPLESIAYTRKVPILIFSGDHDGVITKWERMQSNHFMYSKEGLPLSEGRKAIKRNKDKSSPDQPGRSSVRMLDKNKRNITSSYTFNRQIVPPAARGRQSQISVHDHPHTTILNILFVEELDMMVASCEDSVIYVWGFDGSAVKALRTMEAPDSEKELVQKYAILLNTESQLLQNINISEEESVTNRVAGFVCKHAMGEHTSCVTSMALVGRLPEVTGTYLLSAGWDRRICVWELESGSLTTIFRNPNMSSLTSCVELACDGVITDLSYCPARGEFAYSSSDKMVYIRKFSLVGREMVLLNTLQGHFAEVTCVNWSPVTSHWVTGSEDGTIRIWSGDGLNECEQVLSAGGPITAMCVDRVNGAIVAGIQEYIRVYEPDMYHVVQTNEGHTDSVRDIMHVPERNQYISASWDKSIRVWNAWKMPVKKAPKTPVVETVVTEPTDTESGPDETDTEPTDTEPAETEPAETEQGEIELTETEPTKTEPTEAEPGPSGATPNTQTPRDD